VPFKSAAPLSAAARESGELPEHEERDHVVLMNRALEVATAHLFTATRISFGGVYAARLAIVSAIDWILTVSS
jgi:hypothetical protein